MHTIRAIIIWVYVLMACPYANAQQEYWYQLTVSDNEMWKLPNRLSITLLGNDSIAIGNFTNQGATVFGTLKQGQIIIPQQKHTITPYGGGGRLQWDITAEAHGSFTDSLVSLQFYFQQDTFKTRGTVTGMRYIEPRPTMPYGGDTMRLHTWYKVTGTGVNTYAWHRGMNILIASIPGTDVAYVSGFTDMGTVVACTLKDGRIHIPKHKTTTVPYGADGSKRMDVEVSGNGMMTDTTLSLRFFASHGGTYPDGEITAVKWKEQRIVDTTGQYVEWIDTVINYYHYHAALYNKQGRLIARGQEYDYNIKNYRWQYLDEQGRVVRMVEYEHDLLNGWYKDTTATSKEQGLYLEGKKAGRWVKQTKRKKKWITEWFETYDIEGHRISKVYTYANGLPAQETFYAADGREIWHCNYDEKGNITYQGRYMLVYELSDKK